MFFLPNVPKNDNTENGMLMKTMEVTTVLYETMVVERTIRRYLRGLTGSSLILRRVCLLLNSTVISVWIAEDHYYEPILSTSLMTTNRTDTDRRDSLMAVLWRVVEILVGVGKGRVWVWPNFETVVVVVDDGKHLVRIRQKSQIVVIQFLLSKGSELFDDNDNYLIYYHRY